MQSADVSATFFWHLFATGRYANIKPGNVVLDPMCGVGTIPIEGATDFSNVTFMGGELDEESLDIATTNLEHARKRCLSPCDLLHWNSIHTRLKSSSVDIILCDMPWGQRSGSQVCLRSRAALASFFLTFR